MAIAASSFIMGNASPASAAVTSGFVDSTYGVNGQITFTSSGPGNTSDLVVQPDQKTIALFNTQTQIQLTRYNTNGTPDSSFGSGGTVVVAPGNGWAGTSVNVDSLGRVVVAGYFYTGTTWSVYVKRFLSNGSPDSSFGSGGTTLTDLGGTDYIWDAAIQSDDKIVVVGQSQDPDDFLYSIAFAARYSTNGTLDSTFGALGVQVFDEDASNIFRSVAIRPDGRIFTVGGVCSETCPSATGEQQPAVVAQFNTNGTPDLSFGDRGAVLVATSAGARELATEVALSGSDAYVIASSALDTLSNDTVLFKVKANGDLDATFGSLGVVAIDEGDRDEPTGVVVDSSGRVVVTTVSSGFAAGVNYTNLAIARVTSCGAPDVSLAPGGVALDDLASPYAGWAGYALTRQADGKVLIGRSVRDNSNDHPSIDRLALPADGNTVPCSPTPATATPSNRTVTLSWTAATTFGSPVTAYSIRNEAGVEIRNVSSSTRSTVFTGLTNGVPRSYTIVAQSALGDSPGYGPLTVTPATTPSVPTGVTVRSRVNGAEVSWVLPTDGGSPLIANVVTATPGGATVSVAGNQTNAVLTGLSPNVDYTFSVKSTNAVGTGPQSVASAAVRPARPAPSPTATKSGEGYWMFAADGGVFSFGDAGFHGSTGNLKLNKPIVGGSATPSSNGYWMVASDGGVFSFGDAKFYGSTGNLKLNQPIVAMMTTPTGNGYWLVASDGGIFAFGDAQFFGSTGALKLNKPIVAAASTPDGLGYWLVASDGGVFSFGNASFYGSTGALKLNKPIVGMSSTPSGNGYWLVASDGGIFSFGDAAFHGSTGALKLNSPIVSMASTPNGDGYWMFAADGGVFALGAAPFKGSAGGTKLNSPIVS